MDGFSPKLDFRFTAFSKKFNLPEGKGATMGSRVRSVLVIVCSWCRIKEAREIRDFASKV